MPGRPAPSPSCARASATQGDSPDYDRARLRTVTGIDLPALPDGWRVRDIQIFPARHGTGIEIALEAGR